MKVMFDKNKLWERCNEISKELCRHKRKAIRYDVYIGNEDVYNKLRDYVFPNTHLYYVTSYDNRVTIMADNVLIKTFVLNND